MKRRLYNKQLIEYKKELQLIELQKEVLIGTLLGDASMSLRLGKPGYYVKFEQGEKNKDSIDHLYEIFKPFTGSPPSFRFIDAKKTRGAYWFRTYQHDQLIFDYNLFYRTTITYWQVQVIQDSSLDPCKPLEESVKPLEEPVKSVEESVVLSSTIQKVTKVQIVPENISDF